MPTRTITSRVDLETERQNFLLYEQRIIQERDEILLNMRNHLDQLDGEIIRLGGVSRDALPSTRGRTCSRAATLDYVPSVAPFPPVNSSSTTTARGGGGKKGGLKENNNGNNKNKWGLRFIVNAQRVVGNRLMQLRTSFTPMSNPLRAIYVRLSDVVVGSWWQRVKTIIHLKYRHALETRRLHIF